MSDPVWLADPLKHFCANCGCSRVGGHPGDGPCVDHGCDGVCEEDDPPVPCCACPFGFILDESDEPGFWRRVWRGLRE